MYKHFYSHHLQNRIQTTIDLIVPVYNCESYLYDCFISILKQTHQEWNCLILDDGSTDNSLLIIQEFCRFDHRFKLIKRNKTRKGLSSALNDLVAHSSADYFGQVDADDRLHPTCLQDCLYQLNKDQVDILYTNFLCIDDIGNYIGYGYSTYQDFDLFDFFDCCLIMHFKLIKKALFNRVGGFNESIKFAEDYDFLLRAAWGLTQNNRRTKRASIHHLQKHLYSKRSRSNQMTESIPKLEQMKIVQDLASEVKKRVLWSKTKFWRIEVGIKQLLNYIERLEYGTRR